MVLTLIKSTGGRGIAICLLAALVFASFAGTVISTAEIPPIDEKTLLGPYDGYHKYYIHIYNVDDVAKATVNGNFIRSISYQQDSGWVEITNYLLDGDNIIELTIENDPGGFAGNFWTYGFELRQDDSNVIWRDSCGTVAIGGGTSEGCRNDQTRGLVYRNLITLKLGAMLSVKKEASPYSIRQYQTTTVTVQIKNSGTSEIKDIEVMDLINSNLDLVSGEFPNPRKYNSMRVGESREIQYVLKSRESGTFVLDPVTVSYADDKGNIKVVKSKSVSVSVIPSSEGGTESSSPSELDSSAVLLHGEKTDVVLGEDILLKLSAVNLITKPSMTVQVILYPPSGMSVTGSDFVKSGAGIYTTTYTLNPGDGKDIEIHIKSNQVGDFSVKGRIVYYFGEDKKSAEDHTLTLPLKVRKEIASTTAQNSIENPVQKSTPGFGIIIGIIAVLFISLKKRG